jgi:hypothetical protein
MGVSRCIAIGHRGTAVFAIRPDSMVRRALAQALALSLGSALAADPLAVAARHSHAPRTPPARAAAQVEPDGANFTVTNCNDSGPGSLRQAMLDAHNNTQIDFAQLGCSTITLTSGALTDPDTDSLKIVAPISLVGGKPKPSITIDAATHSRVIEHRSGGSLELTGIALVNGRTTAAKGGCVYANGRVTTNAVTIAGCTAVASGTAAALGGGIWSDDEVELVYSTITGNVAQAPAGGYSYGGGVFTPYAFYAMFSSNTANTATGFGYGGGVGVIGPVAIKSSLVSTNVAAYGGGLGLFGGPDVGSSDLYLVDSTVAFNTASGFAGGIEASADLAIYNSTIANNYGHTPAHANGIVIEGSHALNLVSSIVAGNAIGDISGPTSIGGHADLVGVSSVALPPGTLNGDPQLAAFGDYGGQTQTLGLQPGSPAIDAGDNPLGLFCDQRGGSAIPPYAMSGLYRRSIGVHADIGAFEFGISDGVFASGFEEPSTSCYPP